jgi:hypothetical protein
MLEVADVFRRYGDAYLQRFSQQMLPSHRRAFSDILHCRTAVMGGHVYACDRCGHQRYAYHSCKNRNCPKCQGGDADLWIEQRRQEILAVPHFHVVFTLPEELRPIVRRHQKTLYDVLMKAGARSLMKLAADPRYVGGRIGILAVLQTWTGTLTYHPHVHCLVPAGGVSRDEQWLAARKDYLVPVEALALIFRGIFLQMARRALPRQHLPNSLWTKKWYVYCEPTVQGTERVLQYLGRYIYRVAFANSRLIRIDGGQVTFRYQDRKKRQWKTKTLPATEFIGRFLQHVLPRGTHKVRYYGIWNPSQRSLLRRVQLVTSPLQIPSATQDDPAPPTEGTPDPPVENRTKCPCCGEGTMILMETIRRRIRAPP